MRVRPAGKESVYHSRSIPMSFGMGFFYARRKSERKTTFTRKEPAKRLLSSDFVMAQSAIMEESMDTRIALIGIMVEDKSAVERLNQILHEYGEYIVGRMGLPLRERDLSIISVVVDARADIISSLAGKLGMVKGISVKTLYSKKSGIAE